MTDSQEFSFGDNSVANGYNDFLVPMLFDSWAASLVEEFGPWEGLNVVDLATGTGIVAAHLGNQVGPNGKVTGIDLNGQMLSLAMQRYSSPATPSEFIECSAETLPLKDNSIDVVVCQQGFQFFPDKTKVASEISRILRPGGRTVITTWCPVEECHPFGAICEALEHMGEHGISDKMRIPFDHLTSSDLETPFRDGGFKNVQVSRQQQSFVVKGGIQQAIRLAYATPIGPILNKMSEERQNVFRSRFTENINRICNDGITMGDMVTNLLTAEK